MTKRRVEFIIVGGILAVLIIAVCTIRQRGIRIPQPLPRVDEISEMKATYYEDEEYKKIQYLVPQHHWDKVLDALLPAQLDSRPAAWFVLGQLDITLKNGRPFVVMLFLLEQPPGAFASGETIERRVYYRGGDSTKLKETLRAAYEASQRE
jgi:hypothetical protein